MIVNGGGGATLGDPLAGLTMPPGQPGPLGAVASQLTGWAEHLGTGAAGHRTAAAGVVGSAWIGPDSARCGTNVDTIATAAATLGDAADHGSQVLRTCEQQWSDALGQWHKAQRLAADALTDEQTHRNAAAAALVAMTPAEAKAHPDALSSAQAQADGSDGYQSPLRSQATTVGLGAVTQAERAVTTAATSLSEITAVVNVVGAHPDAKKDEFWATFMDLGIGGPATALAAPGAYGQVAGWQSYAKFFRAFDRGDFAALARANPTEWAKVTTVADRYGADSMQALKAQLEFLQSTSVDVSTAAAAGAAPIDALPGGALADTLDVLGKVALPLAVAGDVYTVVDGKATLLDRSLSGANLAGLGLAASGTETGGAALALIGINGVADWIPVVGEVVVVGTALYLGGEWVHNHWSDICRWSDDAGHFISSTTSAAVQGGEHLVAAGYHDVQGVVTGGFNDAKSAVSTGLGDAKHLASGVVHDLNPLNW